MSPLTFITSLTTLMYNQLTDAIINIINHLKQRQTSEEAWGWTGQTLLSCFTSRFYVRQVFRYFLFTSAAAALFQNRNVNVGWRRRTFYYPTQRFSQRELWDVLLNQNALATCCENLWMVENSSADYFHEDMFCFILNMQMKQSN